MKERQPDMGIVPPSGMDRARKAARQTQNHPPSRQSAAPFQLQPDAPRRGAENGQKIEAPASKGLINLDNGTYDFQARILRRHDPEDLLTRTANAAFVPAATCPNFDKLLETSLPKHHQAFVLRLLAYAMLGNPVRQILVIFVGRGANGKSTLLNAVAHALGGFSINVEPSSFIKQKGESVRNDLARLRGTRLVVTSELATGEILDAALVKRLSGGDPIMARELYKEYIEFTAEFVVFMATNALPVIDGGDGALARRIVLMPFTTIVPEHERDSGLPEKLRAEAPGIFNRLLEGLEDYNEVGLAVPDDLKAEVARYTAASDTIARFIEDEYELAPGCKVGAKEMYISYQIWCGSEGLKSMSQPVFRTEMINKLGVKQFHNRDGAFWLELGRRSSRS